METVTSEAPFPVAVGDAVEIEVHDQPYGEAALGRFQGLAVFVTGAVAGDRVLARITETHARFARGEATEILLPSPHRIAAACPLAERCGGCQWQTTTLERQRSAKQTAVVDALGRVGKWDDPAVRPILESPCAWKYRNKARYAAVTGPGGLGIGYFGKRSHDLVNVDRCPLNMDGLDAALEAARDILLGDTRFPDLHDAVTSLAGRTSAATGETVLRVTARQRCAWEEFVDRLRERAPFLTGFLVGGHPRRGDHVVWGSGELTEVLRGREYRVSAASFFQINPFATDRLVETVTSAAEIQDTDTVVDAYGGVGLFSLAFAPVAKRVFLLESDPFALRDARGMVASRNITNVEIIEGDVERVAQRAKAADVVICDPPRDGAGKKGVDALTALGARTLVYVACDPVSLARDSAFLRDQGYRLAWAQPIDLFPQTYHVETVALFQK